MKTHVPRIVAAIAVYSAALLYTTHSCTAQTGYEPVVAEDTIAPMTKKLGRGLLNTVTGWGEIPRQLVLTIKEDGIIPGVFTGLCNGLLMTLVRTGTGAVETVFFMSAAPGNYDSLIAPRFFWERVK